MNQTILVVPYGKNAMRKLVQKALCKHKKEKKAELHREEKRVRKCKQRQECEDDAMEAAWKQHVGTIIFESPQSLSGELQADLNALERAEEYAAFVRSWRMLNVSK